MVTFCENIDAQNDMLTMMTVVCKTRNNCDKNLIFNGIQSEHSMAVFYVWTLLVTHASCSSNISNNSCEVKNENMDFVYACVSSDLFVFGRCKSFGLRELVIKSYFVSPE